MEILNEGTRETLREADRICSELGVVPGNYRKALRMIDEDDVEHEETLLTALFALEGAPIEKGPQFIEEDDEGVEYED